MKFEVYLSNGSVDRIEMETSESEEATINKTAEKVICQLKEFGFVFYNKGRAFRAINAKAIDEIRVIPDEKEE